MISAVTEKSAFGKLSGSQSVNYGSTVMFNGAICQICVLGCSHFHIAFLFDSKNRLNKFIYRHILGVQNKICHF
jgi:hypothetical protein